MFTIRENMSNLPQTQIIAHRGASKEAPENTLAAIKRAISLKVDYVEIDVRLSKEGIPVLLHDPSAARMIGVKKTPLIHQLPLVQIQELDVGQRFGHAFIGEKIPTLWEALSLDWNHTGLMIEIKECPQHPKILVDAVLAVITQMKKPLPHVIIGSFSIEIIKEVQQHLADFTFPMGIIGIIEKLEKLTPFIEQGVKHVALWYRLITPNLVHSLKEQGIAIWTFTVDDITMAKNLISSGINGIISNDPQMMIEQVIRHQVTGSCQQ
jgi:glycerophosphoryl diester phosphodiesterase